VLHKKVSLTIAISICLVLEYSTEIHILNCGLLQDKNSVANYLSKVRCGVKVVRKYLKFTFLFDMYYRKLKKMIERKTKKYFRLKFSILGDSI
jgi:hypothetical protein